MAEALMRLDHEEKFEVVSAGSRACGYVHPLAIRAMGEIGGDLSRAWSKPAQDFVNEGFDAVITLCDRAANDCPSWPRARHIEHWSIADPSYGDDDPATRYDRFLATRDEIRNRIDAFVSRFDNEDDQL